MQLIDFEVSELESERSIIDIYLCIANVIDYGCVWYGSASEFVLSSVIQTSALRIYLRSVKMAPVCVPQVEQEKCYCSSVGHS